MGGQLRLSVATATAASAPNPPLVENAKRKEEARAAVEDVLARKEARRERSRSPSPPPQPRPFAAVAKTRFDELRTADDYAAARALLREHGVARLEAELNAAGVVGDDGALTTGTKPFNVFARLVSCLLYTSPSPRDGLLSRMPSSA